MEWLLDTKPYNVQLSALKAASGHRGFAYFMEMGLGKTQTAYAEFVWLLSNDMVDHLVVICPQSLKQNWLNEGIECGAIQSAQVWPAKWDRKANVTIINYEALIASGGKHVDLLLDTRRVMVVADESVHAKNPQAKRTKRLIGLCARAEFVRILSGAPIVQSALDIWGQFRCIGELEGVNPFAFRNKFCILGGYLGKQIVGTRNEDQLERLIARKSFRAKKADWTDLPEQIYAAPYEYELTTEQSKVYSEMLNEFVAMVNEDEISVNMVITQTMKLQQICSGFIHNGEGEAIDIIPISRNPKIRLCSEIVEFVSGKVIIFAHYRRSIAMLKEAFPNAAMITGGMSDEELTEEKRKFNGGTASVMVCQLTAGKYGHTLLGTESEPCHTSIFFENNYDLDARIQAEARNHRHGQKYPVTYIDMVSGALDRKIISALAKKKRVSDAVITWIKDK
jgi:SNF2 family DNA or RNA helicase